MSWRLLLPFGLPGVTNFATAGSSAGDTLARGVARSPARGVSQVRCTHGVGALRSVFIFARTNEYVPTDYATTIRRLVAPIVVRGVGMNYES